MCLEIFKCYQRPMPIQVLSWYPPGMADDNGGDSQGLVSVLLDEAQSQGIKIAFLIEPYANLTVGF